MIIQSTKRHSPLHQISEDPSADVVIGSDQEPPAEMTAGVALEAENGQKLYKLSPAAIQHREKLFGKSIKLADLSLGTIEQGLIANKFELPDGVNTVFTATSVVLSSADLYHSITKQDSSAINVAISSANTIGAVADFVAPMIPVVRDYQPHIKFATVMLKAIGTGTEVLELTYPLEELETRQA